MSDARNESEGVEPLAGAGSGNRPGRGGLVGLGARACVGRA